MWMAGYWNPLPVIYPFPLHLSTAGHQKPGISPLVKIQRARVVKIQCAPTSLTLFPV